MKEINHELPKLSGQDKLDAIYEFKLKLFQGLVAFNPSLVKDPNEVEVGHGTT